VEVVDLSTISEAVYLLYLVETFPTGQIDSGSKLITHSTVELLKFCRVELFPITK